MVKSKILYLGIDAPPGVFHYPVIRVEPLAIPKEAFSMWERSTHGLFTSKNTARLWLCDGAKKTAIAIGQASASLIQGQWVKLLTPKVSTQEGIISLLKRFDLRGSFFFYPHSSLARPHLIEFLKSQKVPFYAFDLYKTVYQRLDPAPNLQDFEEIVFTSPSTVDSFFKIYEKIPKGIKIRSIGPVTEKALLARRI